MRVGCDLVKISRIKKHLNNKNFLNKVFASEELEYAFAQAKPEQSLAVRFAAKEALAKALGTGIFLKEDLLKDVVVLRSSDRHPPRFELRGSVGKFVTEQGYKTIELSLSHEGAYALAVVVISL